MRPEAVVFDIGNVLLEWHPERFYDQILGELQRKRLFDAVDLHEMNERIDLGAPFTETVYAMAEANPEWRAEIRLWHDRWIEMATPEISHSVRLLNALRAKSIPVFALSNFGVESFDLAQIHYPFLNNFDRRYVSGHMNMMKPDKKIYEYVEADCAIAPQALFFTDDRPDNIAAAEARGWQTHLFQGASGLAAQLVKMDLLDRDEAQ